METLGKRLKYARKRAKMSQEQLADRVGLSRQAVAMIETGKTLRTNKIKEFAMALDVSPGWLAWGDERMDEVDEDALQAAIDIAALAPEQRALILALIAANKRQTEDR
jgi:transcriptional regulator with XRE-family HTH domain